MGRYRFRNIIYNINNILKPTKKIYDKYLEIERDIIKGQKYNFIHYRYESDFTNYFGIKKMKNLLDIINNNIFLNNGLKIYIATTNLEKIINIDLIKDKIFYKNEKELNNYNFEEKAFIDFLFGKYSQEVIGHSNSSFSHMLNNFTPLHI